MAAVPADHVNFLGAADDRATAGADPFQAVPFLRCSVAGVTVLGFAAFGKGKGNAALTVYPDFLQAVSNIYSKILIEILKKILIHRCEHKHERKHFVNLYKNGNPIFPIK